MVLLYKIKIKIKNILIQYQLILLAEFYFYCKSIEKLKILYFFAKVLLGF